VVKSMSKVLFVPNSELCRGEIYV